MKVLLISMSDTYGGIEKLELDIINNINKKIDIRILANNHNTFNNIKDKRIDYLNITRNNIINKLKYNKLLKQYLLKNKYDVIHINSSAFFYSYSVVKIAKKCGVKRIIVHSHNNPRISLIKRLLMKLMNDKYKSLSDVHLSCSKIANNSLYTNTNDIIYIKNGIDIDDYKYNEKIRNKYRKELNINNKIVYGHVGRFDKQKNHDYLIDLFYDIQLKQDNAVLLLIGDGVLFNSIKEKVNKLNIQDKVIFLGYKDNTNEYLNCMDIFLFPSLYEGLGISCIESQTNGLITYCSSSVPKEANISPLFNYFDLTDSIDEVSNKIINTTLNNNRKDSYFYTKKSGYDIKEVVNQLEKKYKD